MLLHGIIEVSKLNVLIKNECTLCMIFMLCVCIYVYLFVFLKRRKTSVTCCTHSTDENCATLQQNELSIEKEEISESDIIFDLSLSVQCLLVAKRTNWHTRRTTLKKKWEKKKVWQECHPLKVSWDTFQNCLWTSGVIKVA